MSGATAASSKGRKKYKLVILGDGGVGKSGKYYSCFGVDFMLVIKIAF